MSFYSGECQALATLIYNTRFSNALNASQAGSNLSKKNTILFAGIQDPPISGQSGYNQPQQQIIFESLDVEWKEGSSNVIRSEVSILRRTEYKVTGTSMLHSFVPSPFF